MILRVRKCSKLSFLNLNFLHECTSIYIFKHLIFLLKIYWKTIWKFCHLSIYRYLIVSMFFFQRNYSRTYYCIKWLALKREQAAPAPLCFVCVWFSDPRDWEVFQPLALLFCFHAAFSFRGTHFCPCKNYCNTAPCCFEKAFCSLNIK